MRFNLDSYKHLLNAFLTEGYKFQFFSDLRNANSISILLRHDIDNDLSAALRMAQLEAELGINSTYFLMLRSPLYNVFGRENRLRVEKIIDLGHEIGLHYDQGFDEKRGFSIDRTQKALHFEAAILSQELGIKISAVSFHQPGQTVLEAKLTTDPLVNTYDKVTLSDFMYFSDSNRIFPFEKYLSSCGRSLRTDTPSKIQLLTHPMWWVYDEENTARVWNRVFDANFRTAQQQCMETERAFGHERVIEFRAKHE